MNKNDSLNKLSINGVYKDIKRKLILECVLIDSNWIRLDKKDNDKSFMNFHLKEKEQVISNHNKRKKKKKHQSNEITWLNHLIL